MKAKSSPAQSPPKVTARLAAALVSLEENFELVYYNVPEGNRELAFALFKACVGVAFRGPETIGATFAKRARDWLGAQREAENQVAKEARAHHEVIAARAKAREDKREEPPLSKVQKRHRATVFQEVDPANPGAIERAYYSHERRRKKYKRS